MSWNGERCGIGYRAKVLRHPYVASTPAIGRSCFFEMERNTTKVGPLLTKIEDRKSPTAVRERANPDLNWSFGVDAIGLLAQGVLINGDDLAVRENRVDFGRELREIIARKEWRRKHGPHPHVGTIFI